MNRLNTQVMTRFLAELSAEIAEDAHGVVVLDGAGWHTAHALAVPANLTLVFQPAYSPELNPIERVWQYLKENHLSAAVFPDIGAVIDACSNAWNWLVDQPGRITSICQEHWFPQVND